jgi:predicted transposase/invertase (TIGR01784 family)
LEGEDFRMYRKSMRNIDERQLAIDYAEKKSEARGKAKGIVIGRARGIAKGIAKGKEEGKLEDAQSMLAEGLDPALIARITNLPKKQILAMR